MFDFLKCACSTCHERRQMFLDLAILLFAMFFIGFALAFYWSW